jgi:hypothetical protein
VAKLVIDAIPSPVIKPVDIDDDSDEEDDNDEWSDGNVELPFTSRPTRLSSPKVVTNDISSPGWASIIIASAFSLLGLLTLGGVLLFITALSAADRKHKYEPRILSHGKAAFIPAEDVSPEWKALEKLRASDLRRVSVADCSLFHQRFFLRCVERLPDTVYFAYAGTLRRHSARTGQRITPTEGVVDGLSWTVMEKVGVFTFWISTKPNVETLDECQTNNQRFYINIGSISKYAGVDDRLPALGGRSVREVVAFIHVPVPQDE